VLGAAPVARRTFVVPTIAQSDPVTLALGEAQFQNALTDSAGLENLEIDSGFDVGTVQVGLISKTAGSVVELHERQPICE
jgi:hypothetical protein